jgi:uncharacterized protein (DUF58 family)
MAYRGSRARESKLECARTVALALGWALLRQNDAVGVLAQGPPEPRPRWTAGRRCGSRAC